jgi:hypothetical protein
MLATPLSGQGHGFAAWSGTSPAVIAAAVSATAAAAAVLAAVFVIQVAR